MISVRVFLGIILFAACATGAAIAGEFDSILRWRNVGPYRGGRTRAICGVPSQLNVFYMAPVNGGVFKSIDYGRTGSRSSMINQRHRSARLLSRRQIRMLSTSAAVKDCIAGSFSRRRRL